MNKSLWAEGFTQQQFPTITENLNCDVAIIGGGFSGLWSAFHLHQAKPELKIALFESQHIGYGASGRNGGWISADYPVYRSTLEKRHSKKVADLVFASLKKSIDEIGDFATSHAPSAGFVKGGTVMFARNKAQEIRLKAGVDEEHQWLNREELNEVIRIAGAQGGLHNAYCASANPMQLVQGLAKFLSGKISIYEGSTASEIAPHMLAVNSCVVKASIVINATEVFRNAPREQIPLYSLMVATEPLTDSQWNEIGNAGRATFAEGLHLINYAQRTPDNRLAIGGRGARYPFGSRKSSAIENSTRIHESIRGLARSWFPYIPDLKFTHAWGGAVAITRDWEPYVRWDSEFGYGIIGGYAGDGMTMTYLASKALVQEIINGTDDVRGLHFINRRSRSWEMEPIRYAAINTLVKLSDIADYEEKLTNRPSVLSRIIEPLILR
jgi:glycine/D-amino acid oxidase-like deaminating enzyme